MGITEAITIGQELYSPKYKKNGKYVCDTYTVLDLLYESGVKCLILIEQNYAKPKKPFIYSIGDVLGGFYFQDYEVRNCDFANSERVRWFKEHQLSQGQCKSIQLKNKSSYEKILSKANHKYKFSKLLFQRPDGIRLYLNGLLHSEIKTLSAEFGFHLSSAYRILNIYLAFGKCRDSFIPLYKNIGKFRSIAKNAIEAKKKFSKGLGRPPMSYKEKRRVVNQQDEINVSHFIKRIKRQSSLSILCDEFNQRFAVSEQANREIDYSKLLTLSQFRRLYYKLVTKADHRKRIFGAKEFNNSYATRTSTSRSGLSCVSERYEIDSTTIDAYVVSEFNFKAVPRLTLYFVIDVFSSCIVGFYLTHLGQSEESFRMALFNSFVEKSALCKKHNVEYKDGDWPCHHVCRELVFDRGTELKKRNIESMIDGDIGIKTVSLPTSYFGKGKGTVEGAFRCFKDDFAKRLESFVDKNGPKAFQHASRKASLTLKDLNRLIIEWIIKRNSTADVSKKLDKAMMIADVDPTPVAIWNYSLDSVVNELPQWSPQKIMEGILPLITAKVGKGGVEIKRKCGVRKVVSLVYQTDCSDFEKFRMETAQNDHEKVVEIEVKYNPSCADKIWYRGPHSKGKLIEFVLDERYCKFEGADQLDLSLIANKERVNKSKQNYDKSLANTKFAKSIKGAEDGNKKSYSPKSMAKSCVKDTKSNVEEDKKNEVNSNAKKVCSLIDQIEGDE
ncbi:hypothetical protein CWB60_11000 [Pseudoalteromonas sp. S327]|uniref:hypothetical protein n=1 Tax=unclassified Pseudoalteromonas TaxID=194690 RepID=UPI00110AB584|nr:MULTISPECIES: hypothetical protein [unclassified Pseudoalteromonas]TMO06330.1 hypothetical protein CWB60_11000 [Pseudoalteromonas sp. S327]TMO18953.1 hypothetical protein CWB59_07095 [Pseudoalteromonas sp. S326]